MQHPFQSGQRMLTKSFLGAMLALMLVTAGASVVAAAPATPVSAATLTGELTAGSANFLTVQTTERDGTITLTLNYDPQDDALVGKVNFRVYSTAGLRAYQDGAAPSQVNIATGTPIKKDSKVLRASFKESGRGLYTVEVYNHSAVSVHFTLAAGNAMLTDASGQTQSPDSAVMAEPAMADHAMAEPVMADSAAAAPVSSTQVQGESSTARAWQLYTITPNAKDSTVTLTLDYNPKDIGNISIFVLTADMMRDLAKLNVRLRDVNLASATTTKLGADASKLKVSFKAAGMASYTAIVFTNNNVPTTYTLSADGGTLK